MSEGSSGTIDRLDAGSSRRGRVRIGRFRVVCLRRRGFSVTRRANRRGAQTAIAQASSESAAATAPKESATTTSLTLSVNAADRKALSRARVAALNRAQTALAGLFDVTVSYSEKAEEPDAETREVEVAHTTAAVRNRNNGCRRHRVSLVGSRP